MGIIASAIKEKLEKSFNPSHLEVIDESHKHAHHAGAKAHHANGGSAESHFQVVFVSDKFTGLNRLGKHRAVLDVLVDEMKQIHAFSLEAREG